MSDVFHGRAGGLGGIPFESYVLPEGARLTEVHVFAEEYVHAIQFVYADAVGNRGELPKIGGDGGQHYVFVLGPDEYVTTISGLADWYIDQIRLHTNQRVSDGFGSQGTTEKFSLAAPEGQAIVGLYGSAGWFVDSIGIISQPIAITLGASIDVAPVAEEPVAEEPAVEEPAAEEPAAEEPAAEEPAAEEPAAEEPAEAREARPKDLEKIEGIGPKIAALLVSNDILDLSDLAATSATQLKEILTAAGSRYAIADPTTWPEQAALGAKGAWSELTALQKTLKAGRRS